MSLLRLENVTISFGGVAAVNAVNLEVNQGEILSLIGPNGAGKSTVFNLITGIYPPTEGAIIFKGKNIAGLSTHRIAALGISRTFQNIRLFPQQTVLENTLAGTHTGGSWDLAGALFPFLPSVRKEERRLRERAYACLDKVNLTTQAHELSHSLPYGAQRRLEIARALAVKPALILLDEPAAGMNPPEKATLLNMVRAIRDDGVTVFLVEHDMKFVMELSDRIVALDYGVKIAEGAPEQVRANPAVIEAYLGKGSAH